jgi:hypothetical protein
VQAPLEVGGLQERVVDVNNDVSAVQLSGEPLLRPLFPSGTSIRSHWHVLCDQAWDHCRYLQTRATG